MVKNPHANAGDVRDAVQSPGLEDPLEKGMATHSSIFAWRILWTEEPNISRETRNSAFCKISLFKNIDNKF